MLKNKICKSTLLSFFFISVLIISIMGQSFRLYNLNETHQDIDDIQLADLNPSQSYDLTPFSIIIQGNQGWKAAASEVEWCSGSGTASNPYVIKNVLTDATLNDIPCLTIRDSDVYFKIQQCTLTNENSHAIVLRYVKNGEVVDNLCVGGSIEIDGCENIKVTSNEFDESKIYVCRGSNNIEVSGNNIHDSEIEGIHLDDNAHDNLISGNTARNNGNFGIALNDGCNNNEIVSNTLQNNGAHGIWIEEDSCENTIKDNKINNNWGRGIMLEDGCNDNVIEGNSMWGNALGCISESNCQGNRFQDNGICLYPFDHYLFYVIIVPIIIVVVVIVRKRRKR